jgi:hypothetical protein
MKQIDPIYQAYTARIIKYLSGTEFYNYFMSALESSKNTFQFSNRKVEKSVDETWVEAVEAVIKPIQEIIANPRNFIAQEEAIVNVALVKKVTPDSIRHLAQHGNMIDTIEDGNVRPNRLMNKFKEDTLNTYENRFVCTLIDMAYEFVSKRYEAIFAAMGEEFGAYLKMTSDMSSYNERITANIDLRIRQDDDIISSDEKNETIFSRIARLHRLLGSFRSTGFVKQVSKYGKIKPPLVLTNAIAKNPNFKACHRLWNFLQMYEDVGYNIVISEQSTNIDDSFVSDIYHSILFNYIILKNYLENPKDREIKTLRSAKKTKIKPKFITEIIEEFVKNYDLPDVVVRKVLIEEITKAQLMLEEEEERRRLVEEKEKEMQEKRRLEEQEKERQAKEAEKERLRREKELLAEQERQRLEQERKEQADIKKAAAYIRELEKFKITMAEIAENHARAEEEARLAEEQKKRLEIEEEARKKEEQMKKQNEERIAKEKEEERLRLIKEKEKEAALKAAEEERLRLKREKEKEKEKAAKEKAALLEKERLAREKAKAKEKAAKEKAALLEKERLAREKLKAKEKAAKEKAALLEKERLAREKLKAKEKAAKEKAALLEKERLAREKAKAKEKAAKEKAALLEKERLDKGKAKAGDTAAGRASTKTKAAITAETDLAALTGINAAANKEPVKRTYTRKNIKKTDSEPEKTEKEVIKEASPTADEKPISNVTTEASRASEDSKDNKADETIPEQSTAEPVSVLPDTDIPAATVQATEMHETDAAASESLTKAEENKNEDITHNGDAAGDIEKSDKEPEETPNTEAKPAKKRGLGKMLSALFRNQG